MLGRGTMTLPGYLVVDGAGFIGSQLPARPREIFG